MAVALPSSVYAHDCSSASDCSAVVTGSGWLAALFALVVGAAAAANRPDKWKREPKDKEFRDCRGARDWVRSTDPLAETDAKIKPDPKLGEKVKVKPQSDGTYVAEVDVSWSLDTDNSIVRYVVISWDNMSKVDKADAKQFNHAHRVHEEGHIKVAESVAKQSSRTVKSDAMASPQAARTNLQEKLETHLNEVNKELDDRTTRYDEVTDHGRKQSQGPEHGFPGGKDVVLNCP
jgi:hypothetical protein